MMERAVSASQAVFLAQMSSILLIIGRARPPCLTILATPQCSRGSGRSGQPLLNVERFGACGLTAGVSRDLVDPRFRLAQQFFAPAL